MPIAHKRALNDDEIKVHDRQDAEEKIGHRIAGHAVDVRRGIVLKDDGEREEDKAVHERTDVFPGQRSLCS